MDRDSKTGLCLGEAYDWRAGRTWAVFLGSALAVGLTAAGLVWFVEAALPQSLDLRLAPMHRAALLLASFLPAILALAWALAAGRGDREAKRPPPHPAIDLLWLATGLPVFYLAAMAALGLPPGAAIRDGGLLVFITAIALVIALRPLALPGALDRWAARKAT